MERGISGRATNKLTDVKIRSFVAKSRAGKAAARKLSDGAGMYLTLTPGRGDGVGGAGLR